MCAIVKKIFSSIGVFVVFYAWLCGIALLFSIFPPTPSLIETIIGTLMAAAAGTYGAQAAIERAKNRQSIIEEIRNTNAAIMLAFDTCNIFLRFKHQQIKPIKELHDAQQAALDKALAEHKKEGPPLDYEADLQVLAPVYVATDAIQRQVFEKISAPDRALSLTTTLIGVIHTLNDEIGRRSEQIERLRAMPRGTPAQEEAYMFRYFGRTNREGHSDTQFSNNIEALYAHTDDCIQFSKMLFEDLYEHAQALRQKLGKDAPKVNKPDFSKAEKAGLMPDPAAYKDWYEAFSTAPKT